MLADSAVFARLQRAELSRKGGVFVNYCKFCCNAYVDPALNIDNDLGYCSVGDSVNGYSMFIRSGAGRPTVIVVSHGSEFVSYYEMRYCPNCGRYLFENEKGKKG